MSDMKNLLEKMNSMSSAEHKPTGPKWPGYLKGSDNAKKARGRMVGDGGTDESVEESESILKELNQVINSNPVKKDLCQEWQEYKLNEQSPTDKVRVISDPDDPDNYDKIRFKKLQPDGTIIDIEPYSGPHRHYYSAITGKEPGLSPLSKEMFNTLQDQFKKQQANTPQQYPKVNTPQSPYIQDIPVRLKQKPLEPDEDIISEYGAPGSAIGNDTARNPAEEFAKGQERKTAKQQVQGQIAGLVAQVTGLRSQLADLNQQFPQGANPVEKAMGLQQMQAQRNGIKKQIEDLVKQIAALRQQAM